MHRPMHRPMCCPCSQSLDCTPTMEDTFSFDWLNFSMGRDEQRALFKRGARTALDFLRL